MQTDSYTLRGRHAVELADPESRNIITLTKFMDSQRNRSTGIR